LSVPLRSNHAPIVVPYSLTGLKFMTERAGGGDATRRIAQFNIICRREG
jgi:hypothetical protein